MEWRLEEWRSRGVEVYEVGEVGCFCAFWEFPLRSAIFDDLILSALGASKKIPTFQPDCLSRFLILP
jgi:hypothetical protein